MRRAIRTLLRQWGFNTKQRGDCPDDAAVILGWLTRNTKPVAALGDPNLSLANLDRAGWPDSEPVPDGWLRNTSTRRLVSKADKSSART